jgi:hypothetical protein
MKVIRGIGKNRCVRTIDFSRPLKYYDNPAISCGKGLGIPVIENLDTPSEVYFWDHETIRATVGKDRYELVEDNPYVYEQLKNNVELLFALHGL